MCGITGILKLNRELVRAEEISSFNDSLAHRGPDGSGIYISDDQKLGIGHRRLSILDLSVNGKQPMSYSNERYWLTYNGEIFNFLELRSELQSKGYRFSSNTDSELVLAAYQEWGTHCLERFNGMWAFAIWDAKEQSLFLARDRFGIKPLYYYHIKGRLLAFASETIAFNHLPNYRKEINKVNLTNAIKKRFLLEGAGQTIYKGIYKLKAGHFILIKNTRQPDITEKRWWNTLDHIDPSVCNRSYADLSEEFLDLFQDSCRLRLRSDVPLVSALSGGVDSTSVYCTIQQLFRNSFESLPRVPSDGQKAFIASFPNTHMDETTFANRVLDFNNSTGIFVTYNPEDLTDKIIKSTQHEDIIYLSPPITNWIYEKMRSCGYRVSMDGHGADEMLYGYPHLILRAITNGSYAPDRLAHLEEIYLSAGASPSQNAQKSRLSLAESNQPNRFLKSMYNRFVPHSIKKLYRIGHYTLDARIRKKKWLRIYTNPDSTLPDPSSQLYGSDPTSYLSFHHFELPTILRNWDRASMAHGVEIRMPFMDWRLVSFVFSLPIEYKVGNGFTKRILRDAMKGIIPEEIRLRKDKIGINAPMDVWFNSFLGPFLLDVAQSKSFLESPVWNGSLLSAFIREKTLTKSWTYTDGVQIWPYINAHILMNDV